MARSSHSPHETSEVAPSSSSSRRVVLDLRDDRRPGPSFAHRRRRVSLWVALSDGVCAGVSLLLTTMVVGYDGAPLALVAPVAAAVWIVVFHLFGLYDVMRLSAVEEFRRVVSAACVGASAIIVALWWNDDTVRLALGAMLVIGVVAELAMRRVWRWNLRRLRRDGYLAMRTLIVGTNDEAARLATALESPPLGFRLVGCVAASDPPDGDTDMTIVGRLALLEDVVRETDAECLFVASSAVSAADIAGVASVARRAGCDLRLSANLSDVLTARVSVQPLNDVMTLSLKSAQLTTTQAFMKRTFDIVVGSIAFVLLLPVMAIIAAMVRLSSRGPILFRQERVTKNGQIFTMYKFRTMVVDQGSRLDGRVIDLTAPFFKLNDDPRLTKVGRWIRPLSLDELPQLWHVLRGQLSLVGPRPLPADQVIANGDLEEMRVRHEVRTGLTGWWQVHGRSAVDPEEALRLDVFYINNWSFALDVFIMLKTFGAVIARRGAQ